MSHWLLLYRIAGIKLDEAVSLREYDTTIGGSAGYFLLCHILVFYSHVLSYFH